VDKQLQALIFDCDGVLVDTERDGRRVVFNQAFAEKGLNIEWYAALYGDLLEVAGGKERTRQYFNTHQWPDNITLAVCSTSNEQAVTLVVERLLGPERRSHFAAIFAGDVVSKKKSDPEIYNLAVQQLNLEPTKCVMIEDSRNGFLAAQAAGMRCIVITDGYTEHKDFSQADLVVNELGDPPNIQVTLENLKKLL
jgi:HAD superfamily hydrolase (TIGR01549 family)